MLKAEGARTAAILRAEGESKAIETVFQAIHEGAPDQSLLSLPVPADAAAARAGPGEQDLRDPVASSRRRSATSAGRSAAGTAPRRRRRRRAARARTGRRPTAAAAAARGRGGRAGRARGRGRRPRSPPRPGALGLDVAARRAAPAAPPPPRPRRRRPAEPAAGPGRAGEPLVADVFDSLSEKLQGTLADVRQRGALTEDDVNERDARDPPRAARGRRQLQGRQAVHVDAVKERASGAEVAAPAQPGPAGRQDRQRGADRR